MSPPCWDHHKQRHRRCRSHRHRQLSLLPAMLIVLLVLLQSFELHMCRQLMRRSDPAAAPTIRHLQDAPDKRSAAEPIVSQPEEIFSAPNDAADSSYDEYPVSDTFGMGGRPILSSPIRPKNLSLSLSYRFTYETFFSFFFGNCIFCI